MFPLLPLSTLLLAAPTLASPLTPHKPQQQQPLPLLIWHGLGDNYLADGLHTVGDLANKTNPGTYTYYIRLNEDASSDRTATFLGNLTQQIAQVCDDITSHPILSTAPALNALGFSQGGQFLRGLVQRCGHRIKVRNLVTFGSQHNGISKYQICKDGDWLCKSYISLLKSNTWSSWVQSHLIPAQYFKATNDSTGAPTGEYLENSNFLADVNNERGVKNTTYARHLAALENLVLFVFEDDETVIPKESGWFAYTNATDGKVTGVRERQIYKEDWIGLRKLDEKGGLHFESTEGGHMELSEEVLRGVFERWFAPPATKSRWEGVGEVLDEVMEL
ncbi:alpha/beta-hydrolase [Plenodomus tracheiphilus IPT5]|uniref:Palmitoyl-protein thioesterase 1 n=1 Tax=Plenodomus tracheiphilus IPT5 TaxID=1408161 RepID=A0A6A7B5H6_9PLEO|nr:alpha/beta-hydrolase [Plenodomus tracheiphilus IPT5]